MIFPAALIATTVSVFCLILWPTTGALLTIMLKPLIDASWNNSFAGVNCLQIIGFAMPVLILPKIMSSKSLRIRNQNLKMTSIAFLLSNIIASIGMLVLYGKGAEAANFLFRSINFYLALFLFPYIANDRQSFRRLIYVMVLAGIFPLGMGLYQLATGEIWRMRSTINIVRNVGLYHDAFSLRAYGFQTLSAIILLLTYFPPAKKERRVIYYCYALLWFIVIFKVYSKAAVVIACCWIIIWAFFYRKKNGIVLLTLSFLIFFYFKGDMITQNVTTMFSREIGAYQGIIDQRYILSGRSSIWQYTWDEWKNFELIMQLVGSWRNIAAHNDFLRILYCNGIIGLIFYFLLLFFAGLNFIKRLKYNRSPLTIVGFMVYVMWLVDVTGLTPSIYPAYAWYVWGFISLSLTGVPGLEMDKAQKVTEYTESLETRKLKPYRAYSNRRFFR